MVQRKVLVVDSVGAVASGGCMYQDAGSVLLSCSAGSLEFCFPHQGKQLTGLVTLQKRKGQNNVSSPPEKKIMH